MIESHAKYSMLRTTQQGLAVLLSAKIIMARIGLGGFS